MDAIASRPDFRDLFVHSCIRSIEMYLQIRVPLCRDNDGTVNDLVRSAIVIRSRMTARNTCSLTFRDVPRLDYQPHLFLRVSLAGFVKVGSWNLTSAGPARYPRPLRTRPTSGTGPRVPNRSTRSEPIGETSYDSCLRIFCCRLYRPAVAEDSPRFYGRLSNNR